MEFVQDGRMCRIDTPLGEDVFFLQDLSGYEEMSRHFSYGLTLVSKDNAVDFAGIIGQSVTVSLALADGSDRFINGIVSRFAQVGAEQRLTTYAAEIVPWTWLLTRRTDCRIFQEKNVPDIVKAVFDNLGQSDYEFSLNGTYEPMINCVQYRETDFDFVSRLLEAAGIYYFFRHQKGKHILVMADGKSQNETLPTQAKAMLDPNPEATHEEDRIETWRSEQILQPGKYALTDYNFIDPGTDLLVDAKSAIDVGNNADLEIYDYPGAYVNLGGEDAGKLAPGDSRVQVRVEEGDCVAVVHRGDSSCRAFATGYTFDLEGHERGDLNTTYLLTRVEHHASQRGNLVSGAGVTAEYRNSFACIPHAVPFRPARSTKKPRVRGPQTAVVTGPSGEEIYIDKYGRVKVSFHWDRQSKQDENSSCWIRVAQNLAGKEWGMFYHPRVGQEVVVDFLEGDPDQPLVTGRVYNARQPIPYQEPTKSGVKTRSSKGGGADNFNEIRFEDLKGSEELYIHAEKDQNIVVENDKSESVGHDESISIGNDRTESVGNNETVSIGNDEARTVGNNETLSIGSNSTVTIGSNETLSVGASRSRNVGGSESVTVGSSRTHTVAANEAITVGAAQEVTVGVERAVTVGNDQTVTVGGDQTESFGKNHTVSVGADSATTVGKKMTIEAGDEISIVTGKAKIVMKKDGTINIEGKDITLKGSGKITVKASKDVIIKGKKILQN